jgi:cation diffusion facilitator family transporter
MLLTIFLLRPCRKAAAGYFGNSTALIADAAHSLGDLFSDFVTLATHKIARKSPAGSSTFSYGFGKFEAIGSASVALMLLSSGAGVAYHSILQVFSETAGVPTSTALYVAAASVIVKEVLYQATMIIAKQQQSSVLMANAWHHRSDALSSILACIGVAGQMLGVPKLDAVAGFAVAAVIIRAGCATNNVVNLVLE